jgi:hypothetical protein
MDQARELEIATALRNAKTHQSTFHGRESCLCTLQASDRPRLEVWSWAKENGFNAIEAGMVHCNVPLMLSDESYFDSFCQDHTDVGIPLDSISVHPRTMGLCFEGDSDDDAFAGQVGPEIWGDGKWPGINDRSEAFAMQTVDVVTKIRDKAPEIIAEGGLSIRWFTGSNVFGRSMQHYPNAVGSQWWKTRMARACERLGRVLQYAADKGVDMGEEAHFGELVYDTESLKHVREFLGSKADLMMFNFDWGHFHHQLLDGRVMADEMGADKIIRIHFKPIGFLPDNNVSIVAPIALGNQKRRWNYLKADRADIANSLYRLPTLPQVMAHLNQIGVSPTIRNSHEVEDDADSFYHSALANLAFANDIDFHRDPVGHQQRMKG